MAAPVMGDDSISLPDEVEHLGVPVIGAQWPAMMEDDGLRVLGSPVLVEDRHPVLRGHRAHSCLLKLWYVLRSATPDPPSQTHVTVSADVLAGDLLASRAAALA